VSRVAAAVRRGSGMRVDLEMGYGRGMEGRLQWDRSHCRPRPGSDAAETTL
jgi:hypothetical protein